MTSAGSQKHQLGAKRTIFKYQRTIIAFNCKINCVKWLKFSLVRFIFTNLRVVFSEWTQVSMSWTLLLGLLVFLRILNRGLTQFKFVYLTNDNDSHCDRSIWKLNHSLSLSSMQIYGCYFLIFWANFTVFPMVFVMNKLVKMAH